VPSDKSPLCPPMPSLCHKPLYSHISAQQDFIPQVPECSKVPVRVTAPTTTEQPRLLPEQLGKEE